MISLVSLALLLQAGPAPGPPREVTRHYWAALKTTDVWVRVVPELRDGKPAPVDFTVKAFFPGRAVRDMYTGQPEWPKGTPARLVLIVQAAPLAFFKGLSLQLVIDGGRLDLTGPGSRYRNIPCLVSDTACTPNGVEVELDPAILRALISASTVEGEALGFSIRLTPADQAALADLATRINLSKPAGRTR